MNFLLDTHIFIWWAVEPQKLPVSILDALQSQDNALVLSVASVWEMQMKVQLGRLVLPLPAREFVAVQCAVNDIEIFPIFERHVWALEQLPHLHKDPFDRLLAAQTLTEGYTLVTGDRLLSQYPVQLLTFRFKFFLTTGGCLSGMSHQICLLLYVVCDSPFTLPAGYGRPVQAYRGWR